MIITLAQAQEFLATTADEDLVTSIINAVAEAFEQHTGRKIEQESRTMYFDGQGDINLWLPEPAESITAVYVSDAQEWTDANLEDSDDYALVNGVQLKQVDGYWTKGTHNIRVDASVGFASIPADITFAAKCQVAKWYHEWEASKQGKDALKSESVGGWSQTFAGRMDLCPEAVTVLDRYMAQGI